MIISDPIGDMLIRIKNAQLVNHYTVFVPYSKIKEEIAKILKQEGYIETYEKVEIKRKKKINLNYLKIRLKYFNKKPAISDVKRISKPGRRVYIKSNYRPDKFGGLTIISTPSGIKTLNEAKKNKEGGEIICQIW